MGVIQRWSNRYYTGGRGGGGGVVKVIRSHEEAKENRMAWQGCFVVVGAPEKKPLTAKTNWRASVWGRRQVQAINKGDKT